jgi:hypothetical protein
MSSNSRRNNQLSTAVSKTYVTVSRFFENIVSPDPSEKIGIAVYLKG